MVPSTIDRTQGGRLPIGWPHVESVRLRLRQTTFASEKPRWSIGSGGAFCAQGFVRTGASSDPGFSRSGVLSAAERAPAPVGPVHLAAALEARRTCGLVRAFCADARITDMILSRLNSHDRFRYAPPGAAPGSIRSFSSVVRASNRSAFPGQKAARHMASA